MWIDHQFVPVSRELGHCRPLYPVYRNRTYDLLHPAVGDQGSYGYYDPIADHDVSGLAGRYNHEFEDGGQNPWP